MEQWLIFKDKQTGRELCAYTLRGTFPGEREATARMLAAENGISESRIETRIEARD